VLRVLKVGLVLAECYANTCFAEAVARNIGLEAGAHHTYKMGREKVIKKAEKVLRNLKSDEHILIFIDYEIGPSRRYIDVNFELQAMYGDGLHVGVFKRDKRLIAIIFDPNIEEFLCKVTGKYCDEDERKMLKRGSLEEVCGELQEVVGVEFNKIISDITNTLREIHVE
jgi:hypothetical protein